MRVDREAFAAVAAMLRDRREGVDEVEAVLTEAPPYEAAAR